MDRSGAPNSPDASDVIPTITNPGGSLFISKITIGFGKNISVDDLTLSNNILLIGGSLAALNSVALGPGGQIEMGLMSGVGVLSAAQLTVSLGGKISGLGTITGPIANNGTIVAGDTEEGLSGSLVINGAVGAKRRIIDIPAHLENHER